MRAALLRTVSADDAARIRSCGGVGAGAFLLCPAAPDTGAELLDGVLNFGVRWRLGTDIVAADNRCCIGCRSRGYAPCGAALDIKGGHVAVCKFGGYKTTRHSQLVRLLRSLLRESGAAVQDREVEVAAWQRADGTRAWLDVAYLARTSCG